MNDARHDADALWADAFHALQAGVLPPASCWVTRGLAEPVLEPLPDAYALPGGGVATARVIRAHAKRLGLV